jgi:flagellar hook assembly protein FlgD
VYSVLGQEVAVLNDGPMDAGYHSVTWDGCAQSGLNAGSGVYFVRLEASSGFSATRKMMLLR